MKIALVGATGMVGNVMLQVLCYKIESILESKFEYAYTLKI